MTLTLTLVKKTGSLLTNTGSGTGAGVLISSDVVPSTMNVLTGSHAVLNHLMVNAWTIYKVRMCTIYSPPMDFL